MAKLVESVYGDALFSYSTEHDKVDELLEEANGVLEALRSNEDFVRVMTHPRVSKEEKITIIQNVFSGRIADEFLGLLITIVEKGHFKDTEDILLYFIDQVREYRHIGVVKVSTPMELTESQKSEVTKKLLETTEYEKLEVEYEIDPSLIGGMVIRLGDRVVDSSIRTKIEHLSRDLSKIQLKVGESTS